jgi:hypothetical protein
MKPNSDVGTTHKKINGEDKRSLCGFRLVDEYIGVMFQNGLNRLKVFFFLRYLIGDQEAKRTLF